MNNTPVTAPSPETLASAIADFCKDYNVDPAKLTFTREEPGSYKCGNALFTLAYIYGYYYPGFGPANASFIFDSIAQRWELGAA